MVTTDTKVVILQYAGNQVHYTYNGAPFDMTLTDDMSNYWLGEEVDVAGSAFNHLCGGPESNPGRAWCWPDVHSLEDWQVRLLVENNHLTHGKPVHD
jgi:hypothetical protein